VGPPGCTVPLVRAALKLVGPPTARAAAGPAARHETPHSQPAGCSAPTRSAGPGRAPNPPHTAPRCQGPPTHPSSRRHPASRPRTPPPPPPPRVHPNCHPPAKGTRCHRAAHGHPAQQVAHPTARPPSGAPLPSPQPPSIVPPPPAPPSAGRTLPPSPPQRHTTPQYRPPPSLAARKAPARQPPQQRPAVCASHGCCVLAPHVRCTVAAPRPSLPRCYSFSAPAPLLPLTCPNADAGLENSFRPTGPSPGGTARAPVRPPASPAPCGAAP
jgi:hypothetical protein